MSEVSSWYDRFSNTQIIFLGFLLLGVTPLIREPEYFKILIDIDAWDTPKINEVAKAILTDGCIGALLALWFVFRKRKVN
jgi:hypothetical protein